MYGLDIFGAFITADIDAPVYVQLPKGLNPEDPDDQPIWKLHRTLYGLKRAPRAFYDQLSAFLLSKGYTRSDNKSAIILGQDMTGEHKKARHFMARLRFLIEQMQNSVIKLEHMEGTTLPADVLSKPKPRPGHEANTADLMGPQRPGAMDRARNIQVFNP